MVHAREDYNRIQEPVSIIQLAVDFFGPNYRMSLSELKNWVEQQKQLNPVEDSQPIKDDEPVILFRAQDQLFIKVLEHYKGLISDHDGVMDEDQVDAIEEQLGNHIIRAQTWQENNSTKYPDVPLD